MSDNFMKGFWQGLGYTSLIVFVFFPWILGFIDGLSVFLTGNYITSVPWNEWRIVVAFYWPVGWMLIGSTMAL